MFLEEKIIEFGLKIAEGGKTTDGLVSLLFDELYKGGKDGRITKEILKSNMKRIHNTYNKAVVRLENTGIFILSENAWLITVSELEHDIAYLAKELVNSLKIKI